MSIQGPYVEGTRFRNVLTFADGGESQRRFVTREAAEADMARLAALGVLVGAHARRPLPVANSPPARADGGVEARKPGVVRGPYAYQGRWRLALVTDGLQRQRVFDTVEAATAFAEELRPHLQRRKLIVERARVLARQRRKAERARARAAKLAPVEKFEPREAAAGDAPCEEALLGGDIDLGALVTHGFE